MKDLKPAWIVPMCLGLTRCVSPIDAPPAFSEQQYLCGAEHAAEFDSRLALCRAAYQRDQSCPAILSIQGTMDSDPVLLGVEASSANRQYILTSADTFGDGFLVWATASYFKFRLSFIDLVTPGAGSGMLTGVQVSDSDFISLEARGGNLLANFRNETRQIHVFTSDEIGFDFSADLSRGGHIDGCLDAFLPPQ